MPKVPVGFLNGHASRKDALGVLAFPHRLSSNDEFCRFFSYINGRWGAMDLPFQARALTSQREPERAWWILGKNGEVTALTARGRRDESIPGAGLNVASPYGHLCNIRMIAGSLYACGDGRQVYKRDDDQWRCMSNEILPHDTARGFFDIVSRLGQSPHRSARAISPLSISSRRGHSDWVVLTAGESERGQRRHAASPGKVPTMS